MAQVKKAIEAAYEAHIASLYKVFSQAILAAQGDQEELAAAEERFKKGLEHAAEVQTRALVAAGIANQ